MQAQSKHEALAELITVAARSTHFPENLGQDKVLRILKDREQIGTTGHGLGVAIPHGKLADLEEIILAFGRSKVGLSYEARDNQPVYLFMLILSPLAMGNKYLKTLGRVSGFLRLEENRNLLLQTEDPAEVINLFEKNISAA
jgi:PTS system nitrogen regulatory IIA component